MRHRFIASTGVTATVQNGCGKGVIKPPIAFDSGAFDCVIWALLSGALLSEALLSDNPLLDFRIIFFNLKFAGSIQKIHKYAHKFKPT